MRIEFNDFSSRCNPSKVEYIAPIEILSDEITNRIILLKDTLNFFYLNKEQNNLIYLVLIELALYTKDNAFVFTRLSEKEYLTAIKMLDKFLICFKT